MPVNYKPLKGKAGTVRFMLYVSRPGWNHVELINAVSLHVVDFQESMEEAGTNEVYEDILGDLQKRHSGYRQVLSFGAVNARNIPSPAGSSKTNRRSIQELAMMINNINLYPDDYSLKIQFREDSGLLATIDSAIYTGKPSLQELVADSNTAQLIPLEFKSKTLSQFDLGYDTSEPPVIVTEDSVVDGTGTIKIITDEQGNPIICEFNQYSNIE